MSGNVYIAEAAEGDSYHDVWMKAVRDSNSGPPRNVRAGERANHSLSLYVSVESHISDLNRGLRLSISSTKSKIKKNE